MTHLKSDNSKIGQLLIEKGLITEQQLNVALEKQKETGELLGVVLLELGFVDEETVFLPVLAGQMDVELVNLKSFNIPKEVLQRIPSKFVTHYKIIPIEFENDVLKVASHQPLNIQVLDELGVVVPHRIQTVLASEKDILESIRKYYGVGAETIDEMMGTVKRVDETGRVDDLDDLGSEASISKFLNQILLEAYRDRATDIHIEPYETTLQIRYRVDGVLKDAKVPSNIVHFKDAISSRIKILSNLNIAEKRKPQDGRFKVRIKDIEIDLRVSFLPTPNGESVVLRILNSARLFKFEELGLDDKERDILEGLVEKPHGIIFLTGPTGSGKTTTLYSCLARINTEDKKIITIEDPIEYQLKGITQIQINPGIGLTFAAGLRSMLRHDPDVMMVGEVRDFETAEIAIQVALTGHLMFSTLHTNDAASGVTRLIDMGVEPFLITSTVECFIAQRLIRLLCPKCKEEVSNAKEIVEEYKEQLDIPEKINIYRPKGCAACNMTGYSGRASIYEFLVMEDSLRQLIMARENAGTIKQKAIENGMRTLAQAGMQKVKAGITTIEEIVRVTKEDGS